MRRRVRSGHDVGLRYERFAMREYRAAFPGPGVLLAAALALSACSGGGDSGVAGATAGSASRGAGVAALPAVVSRAAVRGSVRRAVAEPTCTGSGPASFVGISNGSNVAGADQSVVVGGFSNDACGFSSSILGGQDNGIDSSSGNATISGGEVNSQFSSQGGTIGGGALNSVTGVAFGYGTVGGGYQNTVSVDYGTIAGGDVNGIHGVYGAIGGGESNAVSSPWGFVGGGHSNSVAGNYGAVTGGQGNKASGEFSAVGGGESNQASGQYATVPGGQLNMAHGQGSFAAGMGSNATDNGDFVWSDDPAGGATPITVTGNDEFLVRSRGGVTFYSSANLASGVRLAAGSGTWSSLSDRSVKTGILPVSDDDILARVAMLPISEWSDTTERGVRHVGPMAQDFYAAFNVGEDDRHITSIDEDGVALAAIKALNAKLERKEAAIRSLQVQLNALASEVHAMRATQR